MMNFKRTPYLFTKRDESQWRNIRKNQLVVDAYVDSQLIPRLIKRLEEQGFDKCEADRTHLFFSHEEYHFTMSLFSDLLTIRTNLHKFETRLDNLQYILNRRVFFVEYYRLLLLRNKLNIGFILYIRKYLS